MMEEIDYQAEFIDFYTSICKSDEAKNELKECAVKDWNKYKNDGWSGRKIWASIQSTDEFKHIMLDEMENELSEETLVKFKQMRKDRYSVK
jgi:hypothetical protein